MGSSPIGVEVLVTSCYKATAYMRAVFSLTGLPSTCIYTQSGNAVDTNFHHGSECVE